MENIGLNVHIGPETKLFAGEDLMCGDIVVAKLGELPDDVILYRYMAIEWKDRPVGLAGQDYTAGEEVTKLIRSTKNWQIVLQPLENS